jgi:hypothetical protein
MKIFDIFKTKKSERLEENNQIEKELIFWKERVDTLEKQYKSIRFDFDHLVEIWTPKQANAIFYKLVNHYRNKSTPDTELLNRWLLRIKDALSTIKPKEGEKWYKVGE